MKTTLRTRYILAVAGVIGITVVAILGSGTVFGQTHAPGSPQLIQQRDFKSWSYTVTREETGHLAAETRFDAQSVPGIKAFAAANQKLASQQATKDGEAEIFVVFRTPLAPDAYRAWASRFSIRHFDAVYMKSSDGREFKDFKDPLPPILTTVLVNSSDPLPQSQLESALQSLKSSAGSRSSIQGVVAFRGKADNRQLVSLTTESQVIFADLTAQVIRENLRTSGNSDAQEMEMYNQAPIFGVENLVNQ
jgi:hypothetical protein